MKLGVDLLPLQERAVIENRVLNGESLLICAPTSSGKTFCGELAATAAIFRRRKAVFLAPLKSIAEERFSDFSARYARLGIRVLIATSDHQEHELQLERGDFDLAILIYEKFNQLLIKNIDLLAAIDLVVVDEVQLLGDEERGAVLELALTKLLLAERRPQIVALSATLANAEELARWLGCSLLTDKFRPVELRRGVLTDGRFRYRTSIGEGVEILAEGTSDEPAQTLMLNIKHLVSQGEQVMVFLKSKRACEALAAALAERDLAARATGAIDELQRETPTSLGRRLIGVLQTGVAFHHADLSYRQRRILEDGYRRGEIRVVVATTTLALGVNLPAQSVFIDCYKYQPGKHSGRAMIAPLEWSEYEAMSGRAGRFGHRREFGRSILIASSPLEAEMLWKMYVEGRPGRLQSHLPGCAVADVVLDFVSARVATNREQLTAALQRTYQAACEEAPGTDAIAKALEFLRAHKLIFVTGEQLEPSPLGQLLCARGIGAASAVRVQEFIANYSGGDDLSWCFFALSLPEAGQVHLYRHQTEDQAAEMRRQLSHYIERHHGVSDQLRSMVAGDFVLRENELLCLKGAFLLCDWICEMTTLEVEERYHCPLGSIVQLSETAGWLLDAIAALGELLNRPGEPVARLRQLAAAVRCGFDLPDSIYARAGFAGEERDLVWQLFSSGWTEAGQFVAAHRARLAQAIGERTADRLIERFENFQKEISTTDGKEETPMPMLKLRGDMRGERVHIHFDNSEIDLTPKSFNYLYKLGAARLTKPDGWLSKDEIEPGFNQAKNIYRVKQELKRFATGLEERIENNKSGFYRLNLKPDQIKIDIDSMKAYSDLELAEITRQVEKSPVC